MFIADVRASSLRRRSSLSRRRRRHSRLSQKKTHAATAPPRDFPGGEARKNILTKKLIVLQLQVTSASPQDNVNIQLGFVIGNYFSLLRSLFSDVIPATVLARIPRRILECACSCALYAITSGLSRRRRVVSPAAWNFS